MKPKPITSSTSKSYGDALVAWHLLHRGVYARVAHNVGVDSSYVSRVAAGKRDSARIRKALIAELERIHQSSSPAIKLSRKSQA